VGTLWTMQRRERTARCALMPWPTDWELRVVVDDAILLTERCGTADEAFAVAERWRHRLLDRGWQQIVPRSGLQRASSDDRAVQKLRSHRRNGDDVVEVAPNDEIQRAFEAGARRPS
jgi:hypothetical protein